ncbi:MAG: nuclease [Tagaea sp. CACIAM 22H2]|nr:nuclease [Tagaea sp. CACIAM 22H2]
MAQHWYWLLLLLVFPAWSLVLRSAWFRGKWGEFKVNVGLSLFLDRKVYRLIKNVTLQTGSYTTQIDHLVISPYGVFVIETKNISGWIFGNANHAQWTQVIFYFKQRFQNPLIQNDIHINAVRELLGLQPHELHGAIVFVGACTFKTVMPAEVVYGVRELVAFIRAKQVPVFTNDEANFFTAAVLEKRLAPGFFTDRAHARRTRERLSAYETDIGVSCPRCGDIMVERVGRRAGNRFLGCRRFPRCRGVRSLPGMNTI